MGKSNKKKTDKLPDDSLLSKNHAKDIKFRIRVQEEKEAENAIKEYQEDPDDTERLS